MSEEGFREIQLSGKQLIALFMAAAVVLIATFLSGVLVGRGVRAQLEMGTSADGLQAGAGAIDPTASSLTSSPPAERAAPPMPPAAPPPQPEEDPAIYARGQAAPTPAAGPDASPRDAPAAVRTPPAGEPPGAGFYLKVVAYSDKAQADRVALRLSAKGHTTWVARVTSQGKALYSVRVGKYPTRKEADAAKRRLEREEQFNPFITR